MVRGAKKAEIDIDAVSLKPALSIQGGGLRNPVLVPIAAELSGVGFVRLGLREPWILGLVGVVHGEHGVGHALKSVVSKLKRTAWRSRVKRPCARPASKAVQASEAVRNGLDVDDSSSSASGGDRGAGASASSATVAAPGGADEGDEVMAQGGELSKSPWGEAQAVCIDGASLTVMVYRKECLLKADLDNIKSFVKLVLRTHAGEAEVAASPEVSSATERLGVHFSFSESLYFIKYFSDGGLVRRARRTNMAVRRQDEAGKPLSVEAAAEARAAAYRNAVVLRNSSDKSDRPRVVDGD